MIVPPNPSGLCFCGCGLPAPVAKRTDTRRGIVRGLPAKFRNGHSQRLKPTALPYGVDETTGCWLWGGSRTNCGYGRVVIRRRKRFAHVVFYENQHGPVPAGLELDHLCRNPLCCNPAHLEAVTPTENKRRSRATKLTAEAVAFILGSPQTNAVLAAQFGVDPSNISHIRSRRSWADIEAAA